MTAMELRENLRRTLSSNVTHISKHELWLLLCCSILIFRSRPFVTPKHFLWCPKPQTNTCRRSNIQRANHAPTTTVQDMRVNHRGLHIGMTEQFLHGTNAIT